MKPIVQHAYGSSDVLRLHDIDKPQLKADGVLVRVHAASINHGDWLVTTGVPYLISFESRSHCSGDGSRPRIHRVRYRETDQESVGLGKVLAVSLSAGSNASSCVAMRPVCGPKRSPGTEICALTR